jgi:hypothetical protein
VEDIYIRSQTQPTTPPGSQVNSADGVARHFNKEHGFLGWYITGLSHGLRARHIGAANKAVVYQWESGKRTPSLPFWMRIEQLAMSRNVWA